ncbi:MAG: hypothetical protein WB441_04395 [Nocardioidaceae bacterium]
MSIQTNTPHIEPAWSEAFLIELRVRGVAGSQIGAALAEVETHCAESGETAHAAFGDARSYATALDLPPSPDQTASLRDELPSGGLGLGGMLLTLAAVGAWRSGTGVDVTVGSVAVLVILIVGIALIVRYAAPLLRAIATNPWFAIVFAVAPVAVFVGVLLLFGRTVLLTMPMAPSLVVGVLALAASTFLALRRAGTLEDPVVGPAAADGAGTLKISPTLDRIGGRLAPWLFPLLTAVMCLPLLLL